MSMSGARLGVRSLNAARDALGIDRRHRKKHGALLDARLCARVFKKLAL
jgi:DNA polymerase III epsilon subunit-like protein